MTVAEIVSGTPIGAVWRALGGGPLLRSRGRAWWRDGDGWSVALDDKRGCWYDHRDNVGGGVLDLVVHVRGGTRQEALRWLADMRGVSLARETLSPEGRRVWARQRADVDRIRVEACYFADAATLLAEWALEDLQPADPQRAMHTALLSALRVSPEAEYRAWLRDNPWMAGALVHAGRARAKRLQVALARYLVVEVMNAV